MNIQQADGIISRSWPLTIRNYWFGQRPMKHALPDIARLHCIPQQMDGAVNIESWTLLTDLTGTDENLMAFLHRDTRKQVRRAEREGVSVERYDCQQDDILNDFSMFYNKFSDTKSEVRDILKISSQLHILKRKAKAGMLEVSRAMGRDGADRLPCIHHSRRPSPGSSLGITLSRRSKQRTSALFGEGQPLFTSAKYAPLQAS